MGETDAPFPGSGEVLIRFRSALVDECHLRDYRRGDSLCATAVAGEVLQPGAQVIGMRPGQPVVGFCYGALAEYLVVPASSLLCRPDIGGPACILPLIARAIRTIAMGEDSPEATLVAGAGFLGLAITGLLQTTSPLVVGLQPEVLELAEELGAARILEEGSGEVLDIAGPVGPELVLEASGSVELGRRSTEWVAKGGTVRFAGPSRQRVELDCTRLHYDQLTLEGVTGLSNDDLTLAEKRLGELPDRMLSGRTTLAELPEALEQLDRGEAVSLVVVHQGES